MCHLVLVLQGPTSDVDPALAAALVRPACTQHGDDVSHFLVVFGCESSPISRNVRSSVS